MSQLNKIKRVKRVRKKLKFVNKEGFRLSVFRSSKNLSAQIIDDKTHKTLVSVSSVEKKIIKKDKKTNLSQVIAELLAKRALEKKITKVYFDRGRYKYHGRIKSFAETLRKNGMQF